MAKLPSLIEAIHEITPNDRATLLGELVKAIAADKPRQSPEMLKDGVGLPVGLFLPVVRRQPNPPEMTAHDRAELQQRIETIDNAISGDQLIARIRQGDGVEGARS